MSGIAGGNGFFALLRAAQAQLITQLRLDARLLQLELKAKASDAVMLCVWLAVAVVLALFGAVILSQGLVGLLIYFGVSWVIAPFLVAFAFFVAGGLFLMKARRAISSWSLMPQQTFGQVRKDFEAVREGWQNAAH